MIKKRNYLGRNFKKQREADKITKEKRSKLMGKIRSKNTKFETDFIASLKKEIRQKFETHAQDIIGKPDIVFRKNKVCVFLDSDFWHGWYYARWKHQLKNDFWREKIEHNRLRDKKVTAKLRRDGWTVIRLWEHCVKNDCGKKGITKILANIK